MRVDSMMKAVLLVMLLALVLAAQAPQVAPGTVEGTLKWAGTGGPIAGAEVRLNVPSGVEVPRARTDEAGRFQLRNVPPGTFNISANAERSFRPEQGGGPRRVTVAPGEHVKDVELALVPAAVITGRVFGSDGTPLTGASVAALRLVYTTGSRDLVPTGVPLPRTSTDNRGEYRIVVPPGEYYLQVIPRADATYSATYFPGTFEFARALPIDVEAGEESTKTDFTAQIGAARQIRGKIPADSLPASVLLVPRDAPTSSLTVFRSDLLCGRTGCSDEDGEFEIEGVLPGSYDLFATAYPRSSRRAAPGTIDPNDSITTSHFGRMRVDVLSADIEQIQVLLLPKVDVMGKVAVLGTALPVPIDSLWIVLWTADLPSIVTAISRLGRRAEKNGDFSIPYVPEARYAVRVEGIPEDAYVADVLEGESSVFRSGFIVGKTPPALLKVIVRTDGGVVQGIVQDTNQKAVPYTSVVLVPRADLRWNMNLQKTVTTDDLGRFRIRGLAPGEYKVFTWERVPAPYGDGTAFLADEFISQFEEFGSAVKVEQAGHVDNVQVRFIPRKQ